MYSVGYEPPPRLSPYGRSLEVIPLIVPFIPRKVEVVVLPCGSGQIYRSVEWGRKGHAVDKNVIPFNPIIVEKDCIYRDDISPLFRGVQVGSVGFLAYVRDAGPGPGTLADTTLADCLVLGVILYPEEE